MRNALNFLRYFFGAMGCLLFFESFATFAAIAYGVIGGKTVAYCCLAYGLPGLNVGLVGLVQGDTYPGWVDSFF